jgi:hypothetical protein
MLAAYREQPYRGWVVRHGSQRQMRNGECIGWTWTARCGSGKGRGWEPLGPYVTSWDSREDAIHGAWEAARKEQERIGNPIPMQSEDVARMAVQVAACVMSDDPAGALAAWMRTTRGGAA